MKMRLNWEARNTPIELRAMLKTWAGHYPLSQGKGAGISMFFTKSDEVGVGEVELRGKSAHIRYSTPAQAGRAVGALLSGLVKNNSTYRETTPFSTLGIMLDCSRNAVMTVEHIKLWMRRLALLGYNMVMLYTEDTYELPEEPFFGYQRGAYTGKELKTIDNYAAKLNIEVIPCIQTLGHLEKILRHSAYAAVRDTSSVMLVGEKKTYDLIDKMVRQWKKTCCTNRIHIGMDETHDLGRGRYLDRFGYRHGFELFNEHLNKVVSICQKHGLRPMIWSDMYFRFGSESGDYYDPSTIIPKSVIKKIPKDVELVYWDYHHEDKKFYLDWIERHRSMGKEPLMASGIWTWNKYWYDWRITEKCAGPCIDACYEAEVKDIFFTQWGDNGAYCDHDSAFAGMVYCADKAYGQKEPIGAGLEKRFLAICGGSYPAHILAGNIHGGVNGLQPNMWDDPFFETHFRTHAKDNPKEMVKIARGFASLAKRLKPYIRDRATGNMRYAFSVSQAFADRYGLAAELLAAYRKKDKRALSLMRKKIPNIQKSVRRMANAFRTMWLSHNKPQGLETIQGRFGMVNAHYREMTRRIDEYVMGTVDTIPELDCKCPPK